jgi:hypothetical protein
MRQLGGIPQNSIPDAGTTNARGNTFVFEDGDVAVVENS